MVDRSVVYDSDPIICTMPGQRQSLSTVMALNLSKKTANTTGNMICTLFLLTVKEIDRKFGIFRHILSLNFKQRPLLSGTEVCKLLSSTVL